MGREVVRTREPGGTPTGEVLRGIIQHGDSGESLHPAAELFLFEASRAQLIDRVILPALERGAVVISDRFADSTTAYQGYGRGFSVDQVKTINAFAIQDCVPHRTVLIDVPVEQGLARIRQHSGEEGMDTIEKEAVDFHIRVREGYLELAQQEPERFGIVDGTRSQNEVELAVWELIEPIL